MPKPKKWGIFLACALAAGGVFCWQKAEKEPPDWVLSRGAESTQEEKTAAVPPEESTALPEEGTALMPPAQTSEAALKQEESWLYASQPLLVNINTADAAELDKLPGIGPAKAAAIIAYRERYGPFLSPEELMLVPGIKEATFARLRNHVAAP